MTVVLIALGSRGDVQPLATLAAEITRRGGSALVLAPDDFAGLCAELGADFVPLGADSRDAVDMTHARFGKQLFGSIWGQAWLLRRWVRTVAPVAARTAADAVQPGDSVLAGVLTRDLAASLAQTRGARPLTVLFTGQLPTAFRESHFGFEFFRESAAYNRAGSRFGWRIANSLGLPLGNAVRRRAGIRTRRARRATSDADRHPVLIAASPLVVPTAPDWPATARQTGYLTGPEPDGRAPAEVVDFLAAGKPPTYVGFGSLGPSGAHNDLGVVVAASRRSGIRIVTPAVGSARPGLVDEGVLAIDPIAHSWLFPRMAGVVHHGGAGTTWAGLRSGVPSAAIPFGVDQPYHAHRLTSLGVGPDTFPVQQLSPESLAGLLAALTEGRYAARASELGTLARAEDGLGATLAYLDEAGYLG